MSVSAAALKQFISDMRDLRPGDVITNLNCPQCLKMKILVLDEDTGPIGGVHFSIGSEEICITPDSHGPFRWDFETQRIVTKDGEIYDHIGPGVKIFKGEGVKELALYRQLSSFKELRLNLKKKDLERFFRDEPNGPMVLNALIDDDEASSLARMEACMNYIFHGRPEPISRREIMLLSMAICLIADNMRPINANVNIIALNGDDLHASFDEHASSHTLQ